MGHGVQGFLNEVLSLNAQESRLAGSPQLVEDLLNEVLSLNAQEFLHDVATGGDLPSSMKS